MPLAQVANMSLLVVVVQLRDDLALSYSELGVVLASFGFARLVLDLPAGTLVQRFNPRRMLLLGLALTLVSGLVGLVAVSAWQVSLARAVHGAASAIVQTAILAWLVGRTNAQGRGRAMAYSEAFFSLVSITIPIGVGLLATLLNWRAAFAAGLASTVVATALVMAWTSSDSGAAALGRSALDDRSAGQPGTGWSALRSGGALLVTAYLVTVLVFFSRHALHTLLPLLGGEQIQLSPFEIGLATSLLSAVTIAAILVGGWTGDRIGRRRLVLPGILAVLAGDLGLFLITDRASFLYVSAVLGVGFMLSFLPVSLIGDALAPVLRARGIALYRLVADGAVLLAPLAVGAAVDRGGYGAAKLGLVIVTGVIMAGALVVTYWTAGRQRVPTTLQSQR
jgi:MFS family permease